MQRIQSQFSHTKHVLLITVKYQEHNMILTSDDVGESSFLYVSVGLPMTSVVPGYQWLAVEMKYKGQTFIFVTEYLAA